MTHLFADVVGISVEVPKSYVVFWRCGKWNFYLTAHHRVPFTFDEEEAHRFDTYGHAYEAAVLLERIHPHVTYVREA